jgi:hypothetical protein
VTSRQSFLNHASLRASQPHVAARESKGQPLVVQPQQMPPLNTPLFPTSTAAMFDQLSLLIRAGNPLIEIETTDERRARQLVHDVAKQLTRPLFEWTVTNGLTCTDKSINVASDSEPRSVTDEVRSVLNFAGQYPDRAVYLFHDLGGHGSDSWVRRRLRDLHTHCANCQSTMILVGISPLPPEIRRLVVRYDIKLPTLEELNGLSGRHLYGYAMNRSLMSWLTLRKQHSTRLSRFCAGSTAGRRNVSSALRFMMTTY